MIHEYYMKLALEEAKKAIAIDEVPIGAVIVKDNKIIAKAHNLKEKNRQAIEHAEILAIKQASEKLDSWNLSGCSLYVTLEPCMMCSGAIIQARISNLYIGALDEKAGFTVSNLNVKEAKGVHHKFNVESGILQENCSSLLKTYFAEKRRQMVKIENVNNLEKLEECFRIRIEVFVNEQHVPEDMEIDEYDVLNNKCTHLLAFINGEPVGTLRIIEIGSRSYKIGRVAVRKTARAHKVGFNMMKYAENWVINHKGNKITLEAQIQAKAFYQKLGYHEEGLIFDDAGIDHIKMTKILNS